MKREIKFRGKRVDNNEWIIGNLLDDGITKFFILSENAYNFDEYENVIPQSIGQFTGLKDKNGIDIYEGDKFKSFAREIDFYEVFYENGSFKMEYKRGDAFFTWGNLSRCLESLKRENLNEIIGNIYENPELLKP